jgi:hypothetical protein
MQLKPMQVLVRAFEKFCLVAEFQEVTELLYSHVSLNKNTQHHKIQFLSTRLLKESELHENMLVLVL